MRVFGKVFLVLTCVFSLLLLTVYSPATAAPAKAEKKGKAAAAKATTDETWSKPNAVFDANQMSDMTGWDPANWVNPEGDVIKIAIVWPHSGPGGLNGDMGWLCTKFAVYDINKRGGIWVDGKKKKIALYKADTMSKPDQAKKVCERMVLQEIVQFLVATS